MVEGRYRENNILVTFNDFFNGDEKSNNVRKGSTWYTNKS